MIDLSYKPIKRETEDDDPPMGVIILTLMPFAWAFVTLIERGLR